MFKTKCGCPDCKGQPIPFGKWDWKRLRNKHGRPYGSHPKPRKAGKQAH